MSRHDQEATLSAEVTFLNLWPLDGAMLDMIKQQHKRRGSKKVSGWFEGKALWITATFNKIYIFFNAQYENIVFQIGTNKSWNRTVHICLTVFAFC